MPVVCGDDANRGKEELLSSCERFSGVMSHDSLDPSLEVRARHAGHVPDWGFEIELAGLEDALGVELRLAAAEQHVFIAGALTFFHQPRANPPDQRMKPEERLHQCLNTREQIVVSSDVTQLVRQNGFDLAVRQAIGHCPRP